ncbi:MAG: class I SAM-dependent methyltransferase [Dongiaceae bacterium]
MQDYYRQRARDYESIYFRPDAVRLDEQEELARAIRGHLAGRDVLEIAAGTGWWTVQAAATARHVTATDAVDETLEIARTKPLPASKVEFRLADAYDLTSLGRRFDAALCCFWLSHVARADLRRFIDGMHDVLEPGAAVFVADNCLVPDLGGELVAPVDEADTYKRRPRADGTTQLVLKNYYDAAELQTLFGPRAKDLRIHHGRHFGWLRYSLDA